jgi:prepilin peptidase CpaA
MENNLFSYPIQYTPYDWLIIILLIACFTDLIYRRIPNLITYPTIILALGFYCLNDGLGGLYFSLGGAAIGLLVFLVPYAMGGMGAGDVKLMGAVGAVLGPMDTAVATLFIAITGGVIAVLFMLRRGEFKEKIICMIFMKKLAFQQKPISTESSETEISQESIPYALAITGGIFLFHLYVDGGIQ